MPTPTAPGAATRTAPKPYHDVAGFCKIATLDEIRQHGHVLTPGRYIGAAEVEDNGEPFEEKMARLVTQWFTQNEKAQQLDVAIAQNLEELGYGPTEQ